MAKKSYLSPSDQNANYYAYGNTNEMVQCQRIADASDIALKRCGFEVINNQNDTMEERVAESNRWGADLHVPIHTNAHNGVTTGTRIFSYDTSGEGYKASKAVFNVLAPKTPGTSESVTPYPALYEIRMPLAYSVYIEVDFHDVPKMAKWIIENVVLIGEAIAEGICNYFGYKYIASDDPVEETPAEDTPVEEDTVDIVLNELSKGSEGNQVKALQRMLHDMGYSIGSNNPIDGDFGSMTDAAVRAYQKKYGLVVDGVVGEQTWSKLLGVD